VPEAPANHGLQMIAHVREDRLLRWSAYAAVPALWLAIALFNPVLLLVPPLTVLVLWTLMRRGIVDRHDPVVEDDPDLY
jgi:hypothetical protein